MEYLHAIGFGLAEEDGEDILRISQVSSNDIQASLFELNAAIEMVSPNDNVEEKKSDLNRTSSTLSASSSAGSSTGGRMSEKQKARLLIEKKRTEEMEEAKRARQKTRDQIRQGEFICHTSHIVCCKFCRLLLSIFSIIRHPFVCIRLCNRQVCQGK